MGSFMALLLIFTKCNSKLWAYSKYYREHWQIDEWMLFLEKCFISFPKGIKRNYLSSDVRLNSFNFSKCLTLKVLLQSVYCHGISFDLENGRKKLPLFG